MTKRKLLIDENGTVHNRVVADDAWVPPDGLQAIDEDGLEDVKPGDRIDVASRKIVGTDGTALQLRARLVAQMEARARLAEASHQLRSELPRVEQLAAILADLLVALDLDAR